MQDDSEVVGSAIGAVRPAPALSSPQAHPSFYPKQLPPRFGLLDDSPERWTTFKAKIDALNRDAPAGTAYKVFWLGRHGQGYRASCLHALCVLEGLTVVCA